MNLLTFYYIICFYIFKTLPENLKNDYRFYFNIIIIVMKRPVLASYSRYFLFDSFRALDRELVKFMKDHLLELNPEQQDLLQGLLNATRAFKRFLQETERSKFPKIMETFTTLSLQEFLRNKGTTGYFFRFPQEIIFLTSERYLDLAKNYESEAREYLKLNY